MKNKLKALIKELLDIDVIEEDSSLDLDSIDLLDLVLRIEDVYSIHIDFDSLDKNISLERLSTLVENIVRDKAK